MVTSDAATVMEVSGMELPELPLSMNVMPPWSELSAFFWMEKAMRAVRPLGSESVPCQVPVMDWAWRDVAARSSTAMLRMTRFIGPQKLMT
jgi:hypothetical protein